MSTAVSNDFDVQELIRLGLTNRQAEIYLFVFRRSLETGTQPSIREIGETFGITSPNGVIVNIKAIAKKGWWIQSEESSSRSLKYTRCPDGRPFQGFLYR